MKTQLNPYLGFLDNSRQAMEFYRSVFGGTLEISTFREYGLGEEADGNKIMHSTLVTSAGLTLMASDTAPGMPYNPGNNISVSVGGNDDAELRGYWTRLSEGGQVTMPLARAPWGDDFGMLTDRFGVQWMISIGPVA